MWTTVKWVVYSLLQINLYGCKFQSTINLGKIIISFVSTAAGDGWMDGWPAILQPIQQYFSHIRRMGVWLMKGCAQWNPTHDWKDPRLKRGSNPGLVAQWVKLWPTRSAGKGLTSELPWLHWVVQSDNSVMSVTVLHQMARLLMPNNDSKGLIFLSSPYTYNRYFFLHNYRFTMKAGLSESFKPHFTVSYNRHQGLLYLGIIICLL